MQYIYNMLLSYSFFFLSDNSLAPNKPSQGSEAARTMSAHVIRTSQAIRFDISRITWAETV